MAAELPGGQSLPLYRLRFYQDNILPSGLPAGSPEEALDCAGDLHLTAPAI